MAGSQTHSFAYHLLHRSYVIGIDSGWGHHGDGARHLSALAKTEILVCCHRAYHRGGRITKQVFEVGVSKGSTRDRRSAYHFRRVQFSEWSHHVGNRRFWHARIVFVHQEREFPGEGSSDGPGSFGDRDGGI